MKNNYYYQVYKVDHATGKRIEMIAEGHTADFGDKITQRTKSEQKAHIECVHGYSTSIYMKRVEE